MDYTADLITYIPAYQKLHLLQHSAAVGASFCLTPWRAHVSPYRIPSDYIAIGDRVATPINLISCFAFKTLCFREPRHRYDKRVTASFSIRRLPRKNLILPRMRIATLDRPITVAASNCHAPFDLRLTEFNGLLAGHLVQRDFRDRLAYL